MNEPNEPKLCLAMAGLLPELIFVSELTGESYWRHSTKLNKTLGALKIPDTEWLCVMHLVEQGLGYDDQYKYGEAVARMCLGKEFNDRPFVPNGFGYFHVIIATFNQRSRAMVEIKNIKI